MTIRIGKFRYKQSFKKDFNQLPPAVRKRADRCLEDLLSNPIFTESAGEKKERRAEKQPGHMVARAGAGHTGCAVDF